jgi:hypothetical protein
VNGLLNAALEYAASGWHVLPVHGIRDGKCTCSDKRCSSPGKHPRTKHGLKDATADPETIERWWKEWPNANVGGATGKRTGRIVLDVDPRHDGEESLDALEAENEKLPRTAVSLTGGGGLHLVFRYPARARIRSSSGKLGPGLDVKSDGGYVVLPPSRHVSGEEYRWNPECHPVDTPLADMPERLITLLQDDPDRDHQPLLAGGERIPQGQRNMTLVKLAGAMRRVGAVEDAIEVALLKENEARCDPALDPMEVQQIARSIAQRYAPSEGLARNGLRSLDLVDLLNSKLDPIPWVIPGLLAKRDAVVLAGDGGIGKSWIGLHLAVALCLGRKFLGLLDVQGGPQRVAIIDEENSPRLVRYRLGKLLKGLDVDITDLPSLALRYYCEQGVNLDDADRFQQLFEVVREYRPDWIILDSLVRFHRRDENSNPEMAHFFGEAIHPLRTHFDTGVIMLHHLAKPPNMGKRGIEYRLRGASEIRNYPDQVWGLERDDGEPTLKHVKCRWGEESGPLSIELRDTEDGQAIQITAEEARDRADRTVRNLLLDAGPDGVLRPEIVKALDASGIQASDKTTTRILGRLYAGGGVKKMREGQAKRYWLSEAAPANVE